MLSGVDREVGTCNALARTVEILDSRDEMARLGPPIPPNLNDIAPASSLVTATLVRA
jgi:hypothetical protein